MRVLAVLYCYPPLLVPAAMCYAKLMAGLSESEIDVEILTISPDSFSRFETIHLDEFLGGVEKELIRRALVRAKGNKTKAAKLLGITRPRLHRRLEVLGLD